MYYFSQPTRLFHSPNERLLLLVLTMVDEPTELVGRIKVRCDAAPAIATETTTIDSRLLELRPLVLRTFPIA